MTAGSHVLRLGPIGVPSVDAGGDLSVSAVPAPGPGPVRSRLVKPLLALLVAAATLLGVPPAGAAAAAPVDIVLLGGSGAISDMIEHHLEFCTSGTVRRVAGEDRYGTAAAIARAGFPSADVVFVATGEDFPDAIAAGPAAAARHAPILLARRDAVPAATRAELARLSPAEVVILGGPGVVSEQVAADLAASWSVTRIAGEDRYGTAAALSASVFPAGTPVAYVATGEDFPDALAGGPAAVADGGPILLTAPDRLPASTRAELARLAPGRIVVLGGASAVSEAVVAELATLTAGPVTRLAGSSRYATAEAVDAALTGSASTVFVATGGAFPDALAGVPWAGGNPVVLVAGEELPAASARVVAAATGQACAPFRKVSEFTTYYKAGQSRVTNIHLIAAATNGAVVDPGETFSLNAHVGERTEAKGYVRAGAIIGGRLVCCDSPVNVGGGTSQFATTLYNAIFFGGYEDVFHRPHSIYFSRYPLGREATLGWTSPDVVFRNDTAWPVTIVTATTATSVTVEFWGWNEGRTVTAAVSGTATTSGGGTVTVTRTIVEADGTLRVERRTHTYHGLPSHHSGGSSHSGSSGDSAGSGDSGSSGGSGGSGGGRIPI